MPPPLLDAALGSGRGMGPELATAASAGHWHDLLGERSPLRPPPGCRTGESLPLLQATPGGGRKLPGCGSDAGTGVLTPSCGLRTQPGLEQASESREPMHFP